MNKHTPGPWFSSKNGAVTAENGFLLASAHYPKQMPDINGERMEGESWADAYKRLEPVRYAIAEEMDANARLIAAAPDLLEALDWCLAEIYEHSSAATAARAAIAKATGSANA